MGTSHEEGRHMSNARWTWKAAVAAAAVVAATALVSPRTARSDDENEELVLPDDVVALQDAMANWDDDAQREGGLATFLEVESGAALLAPFEDPAATDAQ